jgi:hypothetical protein
MPNKDHLHDTAKHSLIKDGWHIDDEQVVFLGSERHILIDIQASKPTVGTILVEVKGFQFSMVESFANAIGKILIYRYILDELAYVTPLWLAVPEVAYHGILSEHMGLDLRREVGIDLIVISAVNEEIVRWIPRGQS